MAMVNPTPFRLTMAAVEAAAGAVDTALTVANNIPLEQSSATAVATKSDNLKLTVFCANYFLLFLFNLFCIK